MKEGAEHNAGEPCQNQYGERGGGRERKWQWILKHDVLHHLSVYPHHSFCYFFKEVLKSFWEQWEFAKCGPLAACLHRPAACWGTTQFLSFLFCSAIGISKDQQLCFHPRLTCASRLQDLRSLIHKRSGLHRWLSPGQGVFGYLKSLLSHKISTCAAIFSLVGGSLPGSSGNLHGCIIESSLFL